MSGIFGGFSFTILGLIVGGGVAVLSAPLNWLFRGLQTPEIMEALQCSTINL